ncbi:MAG: hypothetical protein PVH61_29930 [Candidatus Aminicenantes bacterium]|jgi:hypothetical protein
MTGVKNEELSPMSENIRDEIVEEVLQQKERGFGYTGIWKYFERIFRATFWDILKKLMIEHKGIDIYFGRESEVSFGAGNYVHFKGYGYIEVSNWPSKNQLDNIVKEAKKDWEEFITATHKMGTSMDVIKSEVAASNKTVVGGTGNYRAVVIKFDLIGD